MLEDIIPGVEVILENVVLGIEVILEDYMYM
jgi:hypothetical protein